MSFEFKGAIVARDFILKNGGEEDLADGVCEVLYKAVFLNQSFANCRNLIKRIFQGYYSASRHLRPRR